MCTLCTLSHSVYSVLVKKLRASLLMTREDAGLRGAEEEEGEERGQDVM